MNPPGPKGEITCCFFFFLWEEKKAGVLQGTVGSEMGAVGSCAGVFSSKLGSFCSSWEGFVQGHHTTAPDAQFLQQLLTAISAV